MSFPRSGPDYTGGRDMGKMGPEGMHTLVPGHNPPQIGHPHEFLGRNDPPVHGSAQLVRSALIHQAIDVPRSVGPGRRPPSPRSAFFDDRTAADRKARPAETTIPKPDYSSLSFDQLKAMIPEPLVWLSGPQLLEAAIHARCEPGCIVAVKQGASLVAPLPESLEPPLHLAVVRGDVTITLALIDLRADIHQTVTVDYHGCVLDDVSLMHRAAIGGFLRICHILSDNGHPLAKQDSMELLPLHYAASEGHRHICAFLAKRGPVDIPNPWLLTPLHLAAGAGHVGVCRFLLSVGVPVDAVDIRRWSPLHKAAMSGHTSVCSLLLTNGAAPDVVNQDGETPLQLALAGGHRETYRAILERCG